MQNKRTNVLTAHFKWVTNRIIFQFRLCNWLFAKAKSEFQKLALSNLHHWFEIAFANAPSFSPERVGRYENVQELDVVLQHLAGEVDQPRVHLVTLERREPHQPVQPGGYIQHYFEALPPDKPIGQVPAKFFRIILP